MVCRRGLCLHSFGGMLILGLPQKKSVSISEDWSLDHLLAQMSHAAPGTASSEPSPVDALPPTCVVLVVPRNRLCGVSLPWGDSLSPLSF